MSIPMAGLASEKTGGRLVDRLHVAHHEQAVTKPLIAWGLINIFVVLLQMFIAPLGFSVGVNIGNLNKYFMFSLALWIGIVLLRRVAPLRVPAAMVFLVIVQVWFTVSTIVAQLQLGWHIEFITTDYSLVTFFLCFLQGSMLVAFAPWTRRLMARVLVGVCVTSAFVALLQFLDVPPAIELGNRLVGFEDITNWAGQGGVRAVGIFPSVALPVKYNLMAIGIICGALIYRKLRNVEIALVVLLTGVMLMSQVRNATVLMALVMLPLIVLFVRRHKIAALPYIVAAVILLLVMILAGGDRFAYLFSGDTSTFDFRQDVLWPQAWSIYERRPWFGVGVDPAFAGFDTFSSGRWSDGLVLDNGYLVTMAFGGLPALAFMILALISGFTGSLVVLCKKAKDRWESGYAIMGAIIALIFAYGMIFGNMITNVSLGMFYFIMAGMAMPTEVLKKPLRLGDRFKAKKS